MAMALVVAGAPLKSVPHWTRLPSLLRARLNIAPAETPTTFVKSGGTFVWPNEFDPQQTTVLLVLSATLCNAPAATFVTPARAGGTWLCKSLLFPQAMTVPTAACEFWLRQKRAAATAGKVKSLRNRGKS